MVWTNSENVKLISGLTDSDIEDGYIDSLVKLSQKEVLLQINNVVIREKVEYLDETRKNEINGVNKRYYIKNWKGGFISDSNYDLKVDTSDVSLYAVDGDGNETVVALDSISYSDGYLDTTSAPNNVDLYISYAYTKIDPVTPNPLLKLATEYLTSAYAYMRIDSGQKKKIKFGNTEITNSTGNDSPYQIFYNKYFDIIKQLNEIYGGAIWGESLVRI